MPQCYILSKHKAMIATKRDHLPRSWNWKSSMYSRTKLITALVVVEISPTYNIKRICDPKSYKIPRSPLSTFWFDWLQIMVMQHELSVCQPRIVFHSKLAHIIGYFRRLDPLHNEWSIGVVLESSPMITTKQRRLRIVEGSRTILGGWTRGN